jgi:hypothetical protein
MKEQKGAHAYLAGCCGKKKLPEERNNSGERTHGN